MSARTIAAQWASYREQVLPVDAAPIHVSETQLAFYAGAEGLHRRPWAGCSVGRRRA